MKSDAPMREEPVQWFIFNIGNTIGILKLNTYAELLDITVDSLGVVIRPIY